MADQELTPPVVKVQEGTDVFISYSRADQDSVKWLNERFLESGRTPWIDWSGIKPGEEWWPSILRGIDAANTFLFVLSPDSVISQVCPREIDQAVASGKRIVPVVFRDVKGLDVHPALARLNYIFLRTEEERRDNIGKVFEALDTDLAHVQAHTKFLIRAREWESRDFGSAYLLRGGLLQEGDLWLSQVGTRLPAPTELHSRHILASRAAARRRQQITTSAIAGGSILSLVLAGIAWWAFGQANAQRREAEAQTREARIGEGRFYLELARNEKKHPDAQLLAARAIAFEGFGRPKDAGAQNLAFWEKNPLLLTREGAPREYGEAISLIEKAGDGLRPALVWTGPKQRNVADSYPLAAWSPDGRHLAQTGFDSSIQIWDASGSRPAGRHFVHPGGITSMAWSPDGTRLASSGYGRTLRIWTPGSDQPVSDSIAESVIWSLTWNPTSTRLASASADGSFRFWDGRSNLADGPPLQGGEVRSVAWSPDGTRLATASRGGVVQIWDAETSQPAPLSQSVNVGPLSTIAWSPDGTRLATAGDDTTIRVWNPSTLEPVGNVLLGHGAVVNCLSWSPDSQFLVSGSFDRTIRFWSMVTGQVVGQPVSGQSGSVTSVVWSPDGGRIASTSQDGCLRLWELHSERTLGRPLPGNGGLAWSPDGTRLASGGPGETLGIWDASIGQKISESTTKHDSWVRDVSWSPDGRLLATAAADGTIRIWSADDGQIRGEVLRGHRGEIRRVAWSPDGGKIASASEDFSVRIWDLTTRRETVPALTGHSDKVLSVAWSPDGTRLASASADASIRIWNPADGLPLGLPLLGHRHWVNSIAWSVDGMRLASASEDQTIRIWDAATGMEAGPPLTGHLAGVHTVSWSPDGTLLASASWEVPGSIRFWNATTLKLVRNAGGCLAQHQRGLLLGAAQRTRDDANGEGAVLACGFSADDRADGVGNGHPCCG
ncbi:MAG: TIR domain-containing protein, partial [Verrucomicrobiales bacterium]